MNISKITSITACSLLAVIATLVVRGNLKFISQPATRLYYTKGNVCQGFNLAGGTMIGTTRLTTGGGGSPVSLKTVSGSNTYALFNTSACTAAHRIRANTL